MTYITLYGRRVGIFLVTGFLRTEYKTPMENVLIPLGHINEHTARIYLRSWAFPVESSIS